MFFFLLLISVAYWYCLPVITQTLFFYNEFRGYDFLLLALVILLVTRYRGQLTAFFAEDTSGRWLFRFSLWATATSPLTAIISYSQGNVKWPLVTLIFLFHLWGYLLAYAAIRMFVTTRRQCILLLDVFLLAGLIEAVLISLQGTGALPSFWSQQYIEAYGTKTFNATLGPNRAMPGHAMILVFAVATTYWRNSDIVGLRRTAAAALIAIASLAALGTTGSRTAWVTFIAFVITTSIVRRPPFKLFLLVGVLAVGVMVAVPDQVTNRISEMYNWRVTAKLEGASSDDYIEQFQQVDAGRFELWTEGAADLVASPWLIPFGGGFNNYRHIMSSGASGHNLYITLIAEVGIVGLFLYLMWLKGIWGESSKNIALATRLKLKGKKVFLPVEVKSLVLALMVSIWGGEMLYPYRPTFAFLGMFLFLAAVLNHRALVANADQPQQIPAPKRRAQPLAERLTAAHLRPQPSSAENQNLTVA